MLVVTCSLALLGMATTTRASITPTGEVNPIYDATDPWDVGGDLIVGETGSGSLLLDGGSVVNNVNSYLGNSSSAEGTVTVSGEDSEWYSESDLVIGNEGTGTLNIADGGMVHAYQYILGYQAGAQGTLNLTGSSYQVFNVYQMFVGYYGTGTVNVQAEDLTTSSYMGVAVGYQEGAQGTVHVSGPNATWNVANTGVGVYGTGQLIIDQGGTVNVSGSYPNIGVSIGLMADGTGTLTVTGQGSSLTCSYIQVGQYGNGTLNILDGANVNSRIVHIGENGIYSEGTVNIDGDDSRWAINDGLLMGGLGHDGKGTVNQNGGVVTVDGVGIYMAYSSGSRTYYNLNSGTLDMLGNKIRVASGTDYGFNFNGGRLLNAGTIDYKNTFKQDGGILSPGGSIGQTEIVSGYDLNAGTVEIELGGTGNTHDVVTSGGDINIALTGTTLDLPWIGAMGAGTYTVMESTGGVLTGMFEHVTGIGLYPGLVDVTYTSNAVLVTLNWDYLPGDLNADGYVGLDDLAPVLSHWNQTVAVGDLSVGDISADGYIGLDDLQVLLDHWNTGTLPTQGDVAVGGAVIPEPGAGVLLGVGVLGVLRRRCRDKSRRFMG